MRVNSKCAHQVRPPLARITDQPRAMVRRDVPDAAGNKTRVVFQGDIQNPVAGNRRIEGTWTRGTEKGTFQIRRL